MAAQQISSGSWRRPRPARRLLAALARPLRASWAGARRHARPACAQRGQCTEPRMADPEATTPLAALRATAIPLAGVDPALPSDDLAPLLERLGGARVVGLGEAT